MTIVMRFTWCDHQAQDEENRKLAARGIVVNSTDELMVPINNRLDDDEDFEDASGLDAALSVMSVEDGSKPSTNKKV